MILTWRRSPVMALLAVILVAVGLWLRASALGPDSLWLDDAWISLVGRADSVGQVLDMSVTAPGFGLLLAGLFGVAGFGELTAQLPALVAGLAGPVALLVVARWCGLPLPSALVGAVLLLVAPEHVLASTRVKAFTFDTLFATVIVGCGWWLATRARGQPRRAQRVWIGLAITVAVGATFSAAVAIVGVPVVGAVWLVHLARQAAGRAAGARAEGAHGHDRTLTLQSRSTPELRLDGDFSRSTEPYASDTRAGSRVHRVALVVTVALGTVLAGWYLGVIRPAVTEGLHAYWAGFYLDVSSPTALVSSLGERAFATIRGASVEGGSIAAAVLLGATVVSAWRRPAATLVLTAPLVTAAVLAALGMAPLGGGRTDLHLYPSLALLVASGAEVVLRGRVGAVAAAAVSVGLVVVSAGQRPDYPQEDVAGFVAQADARLATGETVIVYPATRWAFALYTDGPVDFRFGERTANGYEPVFGDAEVVVLTPQREPPFEHRSQLEATLGGRQTATLIASHWRPDLEVAEQAMADLGFVEVARQTAPGGLLLRFER